MKRSRKEADIIELTKAATDNGQVKYSSHANDRMRERAIVKPEIESILRSGHHESRRDQYREEFQAWDYAIMGKTIDGRKLRVVVAIEKPNVLIVTAIDLDKE